MRPIFVGLIAVSLLNFSSITRAAYAAQPEPEVVDGVAAVVNGDVITYSQVRGLVGPREKVLRAQFSGDELVKAVKAAREAALQDLIDRQLIIQAFKKENYQIPDHFIEERMHDIVRTDFGGDRNTFIKTLEAQNYTMGEFKKMESEKMIVQAMRSRNVKISTIASPVKVEEYYKT
ncbi:MAG TPA: SurA N-terminal domain-containing protein, partial [Chthoniobacterales bacterium]|nr:SurA N-terminal domain-containing protein [Chthoniobacterales bacterium]